MRSKNPCMGRGPETVWTHPAGGWPMRGPALSFNPRRGLRRAAGMARPSPKLGARSCGLVASLRRATHQSGLASRSESAPPDKARENRATHPFGSNAVHRHAGPPVPRGVAIPPWAVRPAPTGPGAFLPHPVFFGVFNESRSMIDRIPTVTRDGDTVTIAYNDGLRPPGKFNLVEANVFAWRLAGQAATRAHVSLRYGGFSFAGTRDDALELHRRIMAAIKS